MDAFQNLHPVVQALVATCFTWLMTALGSSVVFLGKEINRKSLDVMLGFAAGVMIAASFWGLLQLSTVGLMIGFTLLMILDVAFG